MLLQADDLTVTLDTSAGPGRAPSPMIPVEFSVPERNPRS